MWELDVVEVFADPNHAGRYICNLLGQMLYRKLVDSQVSLPELQVFFLHLKHVVNSLTAARERYRFPQQRHLERSPKLKTKYNTPEKLVERQALQPAKLGVERPEDLCEEPTIAELTGYVRDFLVKLLQYLNKQDASNQGTP